MAAVWLLFQRALRYLGANVFVQGDAGLCRAVRMGFIRLVAMSTLGWRRLVRY